MNRFLKTWYINKIEYYLTVKNELNFSKENGHILKPQANLNKMIFHPYSFLSFLRAITGFL